MSTISKILTYAHTGYSVPEPDLEASILSTVEHNKIALLHQVELNCFITLVNFPIYSFNIK